MAGKRDEGAGDGKARFERRVEDVVPEMFMDVDPKRFLPQVREVVRSLDVPDEGFARFAYQPM